MEQKFFEVLFGGLFSAIVIMIVKGFFTNIEKRIDKIEATLDFRVSSLDKQISDLNGKYAEIFNQLLIKFSNWEDRIKNIVDDMAKKRITDGDESAKGYLKDVMKDFDKSTFKDIESIRRDIEDMEKEVEHLEKETTGQHESIKKDSQYFALTTRKILKKLTDDLDNLRFNMNAGFGSQNEKIRALHAVCLSINSGHKALEEKVKELKRK